MKSVWQTIGVIGSVVVVVIHTWPQADPTIDQETGRIISARKATSHERLIYEKENLKTPDSGATGRA